ncbi:MAG: nicotinate-nucleotide--dimethylbenzimidazole phosphoribosyltransferase [Deinococcales bacterium]
MHLTQDLENLLIAITPLSQSAMQAARERQRTLTKPQGALGRLEDLSIWLAGVQHTTAPRIQGKTVIVCAADHGVSAEGVSAYPSAVTAAMVQNFLSGGAAINAIARVVGARLWVLDVGVAAELKPHPLLISSKIRLGTHNFLYQAAMSRDEAIRAILVGAEVAKHAIDDGATMLVAGEMGIANTTAASALTAFYAQTPLEQAVGRGTGIDDLMLQHKRAVIERSLARAGSSSDPLYGLTQLGGFEIAAMAGIMLQGAANRVAVLLDGFIAGAAALVACALAPLTRDYLCATHVSVEPGHLAQLEFLGLEPLFNLNLRLGEGTGATLAIPMLEAAARTLNEMATFESAAVPEAH